MVQVKENNSTDSPPPIGNACTKSTFEEEDELDFSLVSFGGNDSTTIGMGESHPLLLPVSETILTPIRGRPKRYGQHHRRQPDITQEYRRQRYEHRKQLFACILAILSGFSDVLCFHTFHCYGNMMTGNTIRLMDHLAAARWSEALYPAVLVPSYIGGAMLCSWLNKLDLTHLGLSGPSSQAFSHLNPPRRLRSPQQIAVLRVVALGCVMLFLTGEVFVKIHKNTIHDRWRLPFFAGAFGLLNAATLAAIHLVTNAVTGHWITVGLGVADDLPVLLNRQSSRVGADTTDNNNTVQPPPSENTKRWTSSMYVAASFLGSIIFTSVVYNECLREVEEHPEWPLALLFLHAPPMGIVFSLLYTILLCWYTLPPPFLQGFSSRADFSELLS